MSFATRYGPDWPEYHRLMDRVRSWETNHPGFHFYDAHRDGLHDYPDSLALSTDHYSMASADQLTRRLDSLIDSLRH